MSTADTSLTAAEIELFRNLTHARQSLETSAWNAYRCKLVDDTRGYDFWHELADADRATIAGILKQLREDDDQ